MYSYHAAILTTFKPTDITFKVFEKVVAHNGCKLIGYHKMTNGLFNNTLSMYIAGSSKHSNYNKHIL